MFRGDRTHFVIDMVCYKWNIWVVTDPQFLKHSKIWDRTGIAIASLCLVHCILFPFLILLLPATRGVLQNPIIEGVVLFLGILVGSISFTTSYRKHRNHYPMMLGLSGVALLTLSLFVFMESNVHFDFRGLTFDPFLMLGGLLLIIGHAWNLHACHCFCEKDCSHLEHKDPQPQQAHTHQHSPDCQHNH